jgi:Cu/Ag efflux protein CusF
MKLINILAAAAFGNSMTATAQPATAASGADHAAHHPAAANTPQSEGEIRKVDREQGKLTLRHGPIQNLDMPAMTMVFKAADPKLLDGVKAGDKVKFIAHKVNGIFTVMALEPAK